MQRIPSPERQIEPDVDLDYAPLSRTTSLGKASLLRTKQELIGTVDPMPDCSEKSLRQLHTYFEMEVLHLNSEQRHRSASDTQLCDEELRALTRKLKEQLKAEDKDDPWVMGTVDDIERQFQSAVTDRSSAAGANGDSGGREAAETIFGLLWNLLKLLQPLNVAKMVGLMKGIRISAQKIRNQDVVLLLGGTGAGKSTSILFLGGCALQSEVVAGRYHYFCGKPPADFECVTVSPFMQSHTRAIHAVPVQWSVKAGGPVHPIALCDSPGFDDTEGIEVDIANAYGIVEAMRGCRSVRLVVLVSFTNIGDRAEGISRLSNTLVRLFRDVHSSLDSLTYIWTKVDSASQDHNAIHEILKMKLKQLNANERSNTAFVALLNDMVRKTAQVHTLRPHPTPTTLSSIHTGVVPLVPSVPTLRLPPCVPGAGGGDGAGEKMCRDTICRGEMVYKSFKWVGGKWCPLGLTLHLSWW